MYGITGDIITVGSLGMLKAVVDDTANDIEAVLFSILSNNATVSSLISSRIHPNIIKQSVALPAICYQGISGPREYALDGALGLVAARIQVNCFAETYAEVKELSEAVRVCLSGYSGTVNGRQIDLIFIDNEMDIPSISPELQGKTRYGKLLDCLVSYHE